ncbi:toll/interleukin-1 receptor domain-containing protein [Sphingomonas sp. UV9]|uniref:toll/interleukin-1 receptor domain-containing protein n=1 Tax=Sphingomonas sp. UV9 TaxID=1851410 RepID=UPI000FFB12BB|nr:toll/interleukin-1 receptor domain-containing protein [Sphingomonas sp. UV9]RXD04883.1 toll/interleukin-1 receptor domain-containing protein [Sphingomonas sp. UV9]
MVKVFLSHQSADAAVAARIEKRLRENHGIACYLDVIDPYIGQRGEDLATHIQSQMSKCTQLLAIVSDTTRHSQWVPWEIGVATEKDFPLATFSNGTGLPPEFLRKWPYLRTDADIDAYARASKLAQRSFTEKSRILNEGVARIRSTGEFYANLRADLGQR